MVQANERRFGSVEENGTVAIDFSEPCWQVPSAVGDAPTLRLGERATNIDGRRCATADHWCSKPITIRNVTYAARKIACEELGICESRLRQAINDGTLERVGLANKPIKVGDVVYENRRDMSAKLGICYSEVCRKIADGNAHLVGVDMRNKFVVFGNRSWPTRRALARELGCSEGAVYRAIKSNTLDKLFAKHRKGNK